MKPYKITQDIDQYQDKNYLRVGNRIYNVQEVKEYLLQFHLSLCGKYKLNSRTCYDKEGRLHIYYAWDSIFVEAHKKKIFHSISGSGFSSNRI